jgi:hypothetical protein
MKVDDGVKFDFMCFEILSYHLLVYLAGGRNVNSYIGQDFCVTTQSVARPELPALLTNTLVFCQGTQMVRTGYNSLAGKIAFYRFHLATATACTATAYGIDINTQLTRSL